MSNCLYNVSRLSTFKLLEAVSVLLLVQSWLSILIAMYNVPGYRATRAVPVSAKWILSMQVRTISYALSTGTSAVEERIRYMLSLGAEDRKFAKMLIA